MAKKIKAIQPGPIQMFLERYGKGTLYTYRAGLLRFFDFIAGKQMRGRTTKAGKMWLQSTAADMLEYEKFAAEYLAGERDKPRDFFLFVKNMNERKVPPKTAHTHYVAVRSWMEYNDIVIPEKVRADAKRNKPKGGRRTNFEYFDKPAIQAILAHGDVRFRAFILVMASSGIRLGEAMRLRWCNLTIPDRMKYPEKPAALFIEVTKTGDSRTVYISREAEQALDEWKKVLPQYRETALNKVGNLKGKGRMPKYADDAMFPIGLSTVYETWDKVLTDAGLMSKDTRTRRTRLNIHRLRNFFSVQVTSSAGGTVAEYLLGHSDPYDHAYDGRSPEDWQKAYRKAEPLLTVSDIVLPSAELSELQKKNAEYEVRIKRQDARIAELEKIKDTSAALDAMAAREDIIKEIMQRMKAQK